MRVIVVGLGIQGEKRRRIAGGNVYVVTSDGELQEGSVCEAMMLAPTLEVTSIVACVDLGGVQSLGRTSETHPNFYPVTDKVRAFGSHADHPAAHGLSVPAIRDAIRGALTCGTKPS